MRSRRLFLGFLLACAAAPRALPADDTFTGVRKVVAIGDIHGDYDRLAELLRDAGLTNRRNRWTGGAAHLVLCGDMVDRGPNSRKVLDFVMALEKEAGAAGGRVHALLGNHEAMNLYGDLRYVPPGEFKLYQTENSAELRDQFFEMLTKAGNPPGSRKESDAAHPLGWVEQRQAFSPAGVYGKWLRGRDAIVKINDAVFLHGGISPKYAGFSIARMNNEIRAELNDFSKLANGMVTDEEGPLWYRGLANGPEKELAAHVDQVLRNLQVSHIVIGHTMVREMGTRFNGKVICIDVGLSRFYGGPPEALVIERGRYYELRDGKPTELR